MSDKKKTPYIEKNLTGAEIRQSFIDFFTARGHTAVPSASLVPGGDQTLLFTNAGMVQFKDIFLGAGSRSYTRAVDSQKCMRVAGKHNDLDDVGRDDSHHTFFEMLGNWSFGDYYKKEAITWAWELLTDVWGLPKDRLWATCFEDELGEIPRDDEAAGIWAEQPGFLKEHLLFCGRIDNFWEMGDTGPCGPDSEIHIDLGLDSCNMKDVPGHVCRVNGDCRRFLELWNLVFIQYNRTSQTELISLPSKHVDTGMGFDRVVSILQGVDSNYRTDLFSPILKHIQTMTGHRDQDVAEQFTPYRVIADHVRAAAFLIADGVVPGNMGRNYVCRMIIRRASRFGTKLGLNDPFMGELARTVIQEYGDFYGELKQNRTAIMNTITEEEHRFKHTVDIGLGHLERLIEEAKSAGELRLEGAKAFELYATYGLPLELTRDVVREIGFNVDEDGFQEAMEAHRIASGAGKAFANDVDGRVEHFRTLYESLKASEQLSSDGVEHDPYHGYDCKAVILAILKDGQPVSHAEKGETVGMVLSKTPFYVEAGGQVSDEGRIFANDDSSVLRVGSVEQPVKGLILHNGTVEKEGFRIGMEAVAQIDSIRRVDIMRNHTATHILHAALREILGEHARQAGSLVAPDRLRFDFTHPKAMTREEIDRVEQWVNQEILANHPLHIHEKPREEAIGEGAMALFGENYGETVRTIRIGGSEDQISYELCGGTHVDKTGIIGPFIITSEGSVAAGIRRIEAITGRAAIHFIRNRLKVINAVAEKLATSVDDVFPRIEAVLSERRTLEQEIQRLLGSAANKALDKLNVIEIKGVPLLVGEIPSADAEMLRQLADQFRQDHPNGVAVLASVQNDRPVLIVSVSPDLVGRGLHAGEIIKPVANAVGGGGGGKPTLAQAGGKDASGLSKALAAVPAWIEEHLAD
ncbi:MAG: alanine--tRNA ligase [Anaerolineales bacterium]|nr:alanine--tRNA ligase [Anaerolineales bacterium]